MWVVFWGRGWLFGDGGEVYGGGFVGGVVDFEVCSHLFEDALADLEAVAAFAESAGAEAASHAGFCGVAEVGGLGVGVVFDVYGDVVSGVAGGYFYGGCGLGLGEDLFDDSEEDGFHFFGVDADAAGGFVVLEVEVELGVVEVGCVAGFVCGAADDCFEVYDGGVEGEAAAEDCLDFEGVVEEALGAVDGVLEEDELAWVWGFALFGCGGDEVGEGGDGTEG